MPAWLFIISLAGLAWLVFRGLGRRPELCLFTALTGLVTALYLLALAGLLRPGAMALFWLGLAGAGWGIGEGLAGRRERLGRFLSPGVTLVLLLGLAFHLANGEAALQWWDEFSHWGTAARDLLLTHRLPTPGGAIMYQEYPPGAALLEYFAALNTTPAESTFYLAHFLLSAAPLAVLLHGLPWRRAWWAVLLAPAVASLAVALNFFICSLMVDTVVAVHLAAALLWALRLELSPRGLWPLAPPLMALPLIKGTGLLFALAVAAVVATCWLLQRPWRQAGPAAARVRAALAVLLILGAPLATHYSWVARGQALGIKPMFDTRQASLSGALAACTPAGSPAQRLVAGRFARALLEEPLSYRQGERNLLTNWQRAWGLPGWLAPPRLALPGWLGLTALLALAGFLRRPGPWRARMGVMWAWLAVFGAAYLLGLLVLYLYCFPPHEAADLASFGRYVDSFLLALLLIGLGLAAPEPPGHGALALGGVRRAAYAACLGLFFLGALSQTTAWAHLPRWAPLERSPYPERRELLPLAQEARRLIPPDKKVYIVHQGSDGFPFHLLRYELAPRPTNHAAWSLGGPHYDGDVWTQDLSAGQWAAQLAQGYDYLLLARADAQFWRRYGGLFARPAPKGAAVFRVESLPEDGVRLWPLEP